MLRPELVLLDLDGTLVDDAGLPAAMERTCAALAARLTGTTTAELVAANTAAWRAMWPDVEDDYLLGVRSGEEVNGEAWRRTLAAVGADGSLAALAAEVWDREQREAIHPFPDARPAIEALRAAGVRTGLVSNGAAAVQRLKLEVAGLAALLDPIVISAEVGIRKPDPAIFGVALHRAGIAAERSWYVGDNLWHDAAPAATAGLHGVWIDRRGIPLDPGWPRPDRIVASLTELPAALDQAATPGTSARSRETGTPRRPVRSADAAQDPR